MNPFYEPVLRVLTPLVSPQIVKRMENLKVAYDGTVRDASGRVVQFLYGDDGVDAVHVVRLPVPELCPIWNEDDLTFEERMVVKNERDACLTAEDSFESWEKEHGEETVSCPVDVAALYERARMMSARHTDEIDVVERYQHVQRVLSQVDVLLFRHYLVLFLQLKNLERLSKVFRTWLLDVVLERFLQSKVAPGEMVGTLAGQSKCLMCLSFHSASLSNNIVCAFIYPQASPSPRHVSTCV